MITKVEKLTRAVERNCEKLTENDRRWSRLEVTINKIFITVRDMNGNIPIPDEIHNTGFDVPNLPISGKTELLKLHRKLKDTEVRKFLIN